MQVQQSSRQFMDVAGRSRTVKKRQASTAPMAAAVVARPSTAAMIDHPKKSAAKVKEATQQDKPLENTVGAPVGVAVITSLIVMVLISLAVTVYVIT